MSVPHASTATPESDALFTTDPRLRRRREMVFLLLAGLFLGTLTMLNILGITRFLVLGSWGEGGLALGVPGEWTFAVAVGVLPYPITFLVTDLLSEFYGRRRANAVVWVGLILNLWVVFVLWIGGILPGFEASEADREANVFFQVRTLAFGAVTASMIAYLAAQFCDVYLFHFWKKLTNGKHLWLRNNGSTLISQIVDTTAVILITHFYAHALPIDEGRALWPQLGTYIATGYVFKAAVALLDTPIIYAAVWALRGYLQIDPAQMHDERGEVLA